MKLDDMNVKCEDVAELLKMLGHPQRLMLLCHLANGEKSVGELHELCELSQSQTSQFLNRMKREGVVSATRDGNFTLYKLSDAKVKALLKSIYSIFR